MKTWLLLVFLLLLGDLAFGQAAAVISQQQAVAAYPELADANSKFNQLFRAKLQAARAGADPRLSRDDWPMVLAVETARDLGPRTLLDKEGSTDLQRPATGHMADNPLAVVPGRKTISGTVFQRTASGLLVSIRGERIWLTGYDAKEGQKITIPAVKSGTHSYVEVSGAERLVDAYKALR